MLTISQDMLPAYQDVHTGHKRLMLPRHAKSISGHSKYIWIYTIENSLDIVTSSQDMLTCSQCMLTGYTTVLMICRIWMANGFSLALKVFMEAQ
jgi:hypothetical protein